MAGDWDEHPLAELCVYLNRGAAPSYVDQKGIIVLNQKCVREGRVLFTEARRTDPVVKAVTTERYLKPYDILINSTGVGTLGRVAQVLELPEIATVDSHITIVRTDSHKMFPRYLGFALRHYQSEIEALAEGSTGQTELSRTRLGNLHIPVPSDKEQRVIAHILSTLDEKIEMNRKANETLEKIARALFKAWFVDFDPVRAKAAGRDPALPKHIADLFPDSLEDSELGEIPKGWGVKNLGDMLELAYGKALKAEDRHEGSVPVYGSNGQVGWHNECLVAGPGIVVGRKGNPGITTWVPTDFFPIDTTFYVVPTEACRSPYFLFHALYNQDLASLGADSAVPGLNRNLAYMSKQVLPPATLLEIFDYYSSRLSQRIYVSDLQSKTLATLRDILMPKLITGELRVMDAKRFLKGCE